MSKPRKLELQAYLNEIAGCGDSLLFKVQAWRTNAAGNHESYVLELKTCRGAARRLLAELRKMHVRDRERLSREQARIEREVRELTQEQSL